MKRIIFASILLLGSNLAHAGSPPGIPIGALGNANGVAQLDASKNVPLANMGNLPSALADVGGAPTSCPFIIINSGQSNAEGFDYSGGATTHTLGANILTLNSVSNPTSIITAAYGTSPYDQTTSANGGSTSVAYNAYVNQALSAATFLRNSGRIPAARPILVVPNWRGNQSISDWVDKTPIDMWTPLIQATNLVESAYPGCGINEVIWDQGEADSVSGSNYNSFSLYQAAFTRLIAQYQTLPGWTSQTRMQVVELAPFADNPEQARNDFLRTLQGGQGGSGIAGTVNTWPFITFVSGSGLWESTQNVAEHYDGYSQMILGQRIAQAQISQQMFGAYSEAITSGGSAYAGPPPPIVLTSAGAALSPDQLRTGALVLAGGGTVTLPNPASMPSPFPPIVISAQAGTTTTIAPSGTVAVDGIGNVSSFSLNSGDTYLVFMQSATTWVFKKIWSTGGGNGGAGLSFFTGSGIITSTSNFPYSQTLGASYTLNGGNLTLTPGKGSNLVLSDLVAASTVTLSSGNFQLPNGSTVSSLTMQPGQTAWIVSGYGTSNSELRMYVENLSPLIATTASIGGSSLAAGACATTSTTVAGSALGQFVKTAPAAAIDPGAGWNLRSLVSAAGTVTTYLCNGTGAAATPTAATYNLSVGY